jgi:hypothetical protein
MGNAKWRKLRKIREYSVKFITVKNLGWQVSNGIGGKFQPEQVADLERNGWQV